MAACTPDSMRGAREGSPAGYSVSGFAGSAGEADSQSNGACVRKGRNLAPVGELIERLACASGTTNPATGIAEPMLASLARKQYSLSDGPRPVSLGVRLEWTGGFIRAGGPVLTKSVERLTRSSSDGWVDEMRRIIGVGRFGTPIPRTWVTSVALRHRGFSHVDPRPELQTHWKT